MNRRWIFLVLAVGMISPAQADKHFSWKQAKEWVEQGDILSLEAILQNHPLPGSLLDAELERENGILLYELKWRDDKGRLSTTRIDARTGKPLHEPLAHEPLAQ